jgi:HEAT repeat protein
MSTIAALLVAVLSSQAVPPSTADTMQSDVDRLVRAAEQLTGTWPLGPPPPVSEIDLVTRHGRRVVPLLVTLLLDDPDVADRKRWKVAQQATLALCRIYSESQQCGRTYCDADVPERIARVKEGWLRLIASDAELRALPSKELLNRFRQEGVFWRQSQIGTALAATGDRDIVAALAPWLTHEDRHIRGNVALVLGRLRDPRGFATIAEILADRSERPVGQGHPAGRWSVHAQVRADRYYAAHLLGDLKDPRGVELLIPLLNDPDTASIAPWALAEIGDRRAITALIAQLGRNDPSARVLAISALERLNAHEALPKLSELQQDNRKANFGQLTSVAEAAKRAIAMISAQR